MDGVRQLDPRQASQPGRLNEDLTSDRTDGEKAVILQQFQIGFSDVGAPRFQRLDETFGEAQLAGYRREIPSVQGSQHLPRRPGPGLHRFQRVDEEIGVEIDLGAEPFPQRSQLSRSARRKASTSAASL